MFALVWGKVEVGAPQCVGRQRSWLMRGSGTCEWDEPSLGQVVPGNTWRGSIEGNSPPVMVDGLRVEVVGGGD